MATKRLKPNTASTAQPIRSTSGACIRNYRRSAAADACPELGLASPRGAAIANTRPDVAIAAGSSQDLLRRPIGTPERSCPADRMFALGNALEAQALPSLRASRGGVQRLLGSYGVAGFDCRGSSGRFACLARRCREGLWVRTYPDTAALRQVAGVGPIAALICVLAVEDPGRFPSIRDMASPSASCPRAATQSRRPRETKRPRGSWLRWRSSKPPR